MSGQKSSNPWEVVNGEILLRFKREEIPANQERRLRKVIVNSMYSDGLQLKGKIFECIFVSHIFKLIDEKEHIELPNGIE